MITNTTPHTGTTRVMSGVKALLITLAISSALATVTSCGAVNAALEEGSQPSITATTPIYTEEMYLRYLEPETVGFGPDPSGSLSLSDGDISWAQSIQSTTAGSVTDRLPPLPTDDEAFSLGAEGVPELRLFYMPVASISGQWAGEGSSIEVTIPGVPTLAPEPQPNEEDDVPGRNGKGQAWEAAKTTYIAAYNAAATKAEALSQQIATFPLESQWSDVYGSVSRMANRMGGVGTIVVFSDLLDTLGTATAPDLSGVTVIAVQACTATAAECDAAAAAFVQFVTSGGGQTPRVTGHEAANDIITNLLSNGG